MGRIALKDKFDTGIAGSGFTSVHVPVLSEYTRLETGEKYYVPTGLHTGATRIIITNENGIPSVVYSVSASTYVDAKYLGSEDVSYYITSVVATGGSIGDAVSNLPFVKNITGKAGDLDSTGARIYASVRLMNKHQNNAEGNFSIALIGKQSLVVKWLNIASENVKSKINYDDVPTKEGDGSDILDKLFGTGETFNPSALSITELTEGVDYGIVVWSQDSSYTTTDDKYYYENGIPTGTIFQIIVPENMTTDDIEYTFSALARVDGTFDSYTKANRDTIEITESGKSSEYENVYDASKVNIYWTTNGLNYVENTTNLYGDIMTEKDSDVSFNNSHTLLRTAKIYYVPSETGGKGDEGVSEFDVDIENGTYSSIGIAGLSNDTEILSGQAFWNYDTFITEVETNYTDFSEKYTKILGINFGLASYYVPYGTSTRTYYDYNDLFVFTGSTADTQSEIDNGDYASGCWDDIVSLFKSGSTSGILYGISAGAGDSITINGKLIISTAVAGEGYHYRSKLEEVSYEVSHIGYITETGTLTKDSPSKVVTLKEVTTYTYTITPVPSDATVKINGVETATTSTTATSISYEVSKDGYVTKSGNTSETALTVTLEEEAFFSMSCSPSSTEDNPVATSVTSFTITITTNLPWDVNAEIGNAEFSEDSGTGSTAITVTITANTSTTEQQYVHIVGNGYSTAGDILSDEIHIWQDVAEEVVSEISLSSSTSSIDSGETVFTFGVMSNTGWSLTASEGLSLSQSTGENNATITATASTNTDTTSTRPLTITATTTDSYTSATLTVTQAKAQEEETVNYYAITTSNIGTDTSATITFTGTTNAEGKYKENTEVNYTISGSNSNCIVTYATINGNPVSGIMSDSSSYTGTFTIIEDTEINFEVLDSSEEPEEEEEATE